MITIIFPSPISGSIPCTGFFWVKFSETYFPLILFYFIFLCKKISIIKIIWKKKKKKRQKDKKVRKEQVKKDRKQNTKSKENQKMGRPSEKGQERKLKKKWFIAPRIKRGEGHLLFLMECTFETGVEEKGEVKEKMTKKIKLSLTDRKAICFSSFVDWQEGHSLWHSEFRPVFGIYKTYNSSMCL